MGLLSLVGKGSECHCYHAIFVRLGDGASIFPSWKWTFVFLPLGPSTRS